MADYNDGKWHGWNGGECPVHGLSIVDAIEYSGVTYINNEADILLWDAEIEYDQIVAFRVIKEYKEPREWWVHPHCNDVSSSPVFGYIHVREVMDDE